MSKFSDWALENSNSPVQAGERAERSMCYRSALTKPDPASLWCSSASRSGGTFPDDDGSRQEVKNTLFVGESDNHGMAEPDRRAWGTGGADLSGRTMPRGL